jgi:hypothetical protein
MSLDAYIIDHFFVSLLLIRKSRATMLSIQYQLHLLNTKICDVI